jgi:hypothetical protein
MGMLLGCCLGIAVLTASEVSPETITPAPPPSAYDIEAIIEEDYVNRTLVQRAPSLPQPLRLIAGHLDIHPGGAADFAARVDLGPVQPVFRGSIALAPTDTGELDVTLSQVRMGHIPVTMFVPGSLLEAVDQDINSQLTEHTGAAGVRLIGVTSDESSLHFYLASAP